MNKDKNPATSNSEEYKRFIETMQAFTEASNTLTALQLETNQEYQALVESQVAEYSEAQAKVQELEKALEAYALLHPEWFKGKSKTLSTPFGKASLRDSHPLEIPDPALTLQRIKRETETNRGFFPADFIRITEELNKEALETLDDATLARFGVKRVTKTNFKAEPAKVNLGKAADASEAKEAA